MAFIRKIINDPVYGFISIDHPLILSVIAHPYYQRLRRIHQMAFAHLVYPGAMHSRLHHSLGAYHLMSCAINELRGKGTSITAEEELGAKIAILLHDIGHGPYSHALENELIPGVHHETISLLLMQTLDKEYSGQLQMGIEIFRNNYHKKFLHQLVSGQLDVDRMDYLSRDSFFTGVAEGVISYDRILKMLAVQDDDLMIEEKGIYSIEKFLVARRLMYWQVYLHKAVMGAELLLVKIIRRAKQLSQNGTPAPAATPAFNFFLNSNESISVGSHLDMFCNVDDYDVMCTIKNWHHHPDKILSTLSDCLVNRKLFKVVLQAEPFDESVLQQKKAALMGRLQLSKEDVNYFAFTGEVMNTTYDSRDERINILFKDGNVRDISQIDNALIHHQLAGPVKKYYFCYYR